MMAWLATHIGAHPLYLPHADGPQIVPLRPPQRFVTRDPIPVRDPGARPFESLHQSRYVESRRELQYHMDVILHDSQFDDPRAVPARLRREESTEKRSNRFIDQRKSGKGRPYRMCEQSNRHVASFEPFGKF
jgi:hypothetical protein